MNLKQEALSFVKDTVNMLVLYLAFIPLSILVVVVQAFFHISPAIMKYVCMAIGIGWGCVIIFCDTKKYLRIWK